MAISTRVLKVAETKTQLVLHILSRCDGTGADETDLVVADRSALSAIDGSIPDSLDIEAVQFNIQGFTRVDFDWDHTTDDPALSLAGVGYNDLAGAGVGGGTGGLKDPRSAGATGDLLMSTVGGAAQGSADITLWLRKAHV